MTPPCVHLYNLYFCHNLLGIFKNKMLIASACSEQVHRNFIPPPSLWPGRELRAYHCPSCASWRNTGATRILLRTVLTADQTDRRSTKLECTGSGLFNFQGTGKHGAPYISKYGQFFASYIRGQKNSKNAGFRYPETGIRLKS